MRTLRTLVAASVLLAVGGVACSGDDDESAEDAVAAEEVAADDAGEEPEDEPVPEPEPAATGSACEVLTLEEVATAVHPDVQLVEDEVVDGVSICTYQVESGLEGAQLQLGLPGGRSQFDFDRDARGGEPVADIGDDAFFVDALSQATVQVLAGDAHFALTVYYGDEGRKALSIDAAQQLAAQTAEELS